jgi:hypothetical protein
MTDLLTDALSNPIIPAIGLAVGATVVALWLAAAWWAYRDAARRAGSPYVGLLASAWIVLSSPFLLPLSLAVYGMARPQHTAAEHRSRRLVAQLVDQLEAADGERCPTCRMTIDAAWLRCPSCATWLAQPCSHCGGWSEPSLEICPWCGSEGRDAPSVEPLQPVAVLAPPPEQPTAQRRKQRARPRRQVSSGAPRDVRQPRRVAAMTGAAMADARAPIAARTR